MLGDIIAKWVVTKFKTNDFYTFIIKEVCVNLEDWEDKNKTTARCYFKEDKNKKEIILEKRGLYDKKIAKIKMKEREITRIFKEINKKEDGTWVCACCGKTIYNKEDCTIDHIKPKSKFKKDLEGNLLKEEWFICWNEKNLQILCYKCNQRKRSMSTRKSKELTGKSNKIRKKARKSKGKIKNKIRFGIKGTDKDAIEIARRDSNCIDINCFFRKK